MNSRKSSTRLSAVLIGILVLLLTACSGGGASGGGASGIPAPDPTVGIEAGTYTVETLTDTGSFIYQKSGLSNNDVYFIFTNYTEYDASSRPAADSLHSRTIYTKPIRITPSIVAQRGSAEVSRNNEAVVRSLVSKQSNLSMSAFTQASELSLNSVGDQQSFFDDVYAQSHNDYLNAEVDCTLKVQRVVSTAFGNKTLEIWVADNCYDGSSTKQHDVTDVLIASVADSFLSTDDDNDIYDWITNTFGEEWGASYANFDNLIADQDVITIVIHDIDEDNSDTGGVVGYFSSTHNRNDISYSNQCIRFSLDAVMLAAPDSGDFSWFDECISTLAHEFQHMIHFYQKQVVHGINQNTDTWLNEMCSLIAEELVSTKLKIDGPRGVAWATGTAGTVNNSSGRLPDYWPENSLIEWDYADVYPDYAASYSFGAYLARNYGGAGLFQGIVQSPYTDSAAITSVIPGETMESLLVKWGVASLISDMDSPNPEVIYNRNGFLDVSLSDTIYELGSINLFNYIFEFEDVDNPRIWLTNGTGYPFIYTPFYYIGVSDQESASNLFYEAGSNISDTRSWDITLPPGVRMTVLIK